MVVVKIEMSCGKKNLLKEFQTTTTANKQQRILHTTTTTTPYLIPSFYLTNGTASWPEYG